MPSMLYAWVFITFILNSSSLPIQNMNGKQMQQINIDSSNIYNPNSIPNQTIKNTINKKDVFISRGWGAGGMPFSVLYMNPITSSKSPVQMEKTYNNLPSSDFQPKEHRPKALPQVKSSIVSSPTPTRRKQGQFLAIPQLFVSYGWGPLGK